ncbi:MAG: hypothetical protein ACE14L_11525 [Terriglobales bacterium]
MTDEPFALDLREFAFRALDIAKENLQNDGHLVPVAFLVTPGGVDVMDASFDNEDQKVTRHTAIVAAARTSNAAAIITINDAHMGSAADPEGYYWGKLAAEGAPECLLLTISGPAITTWNLLLPYRRTADGITFGDPVEKYGTELNFLPGWPGGPAQPS